MKKRLILLLLLLLLAACAGEPTATPDLVATQIAIEDAAHATMTARAPTATLTPASREGGAATIMPTPLSGPTTTPAAGPTVTPPPLIEAEEYAVYAALIEQQVLGYDLGSFVVIREYTMSDDSVLERALEEAGTLPAGLADSYRSRNNVSYTLEPNLDLGLPYGLLAGQESDAILRQGGAAWTDFQAAYPESRGIVLFSRVGFDASGKTALVSIGTVCGDLCGAGGLFLLVKEDGAWKFQEALMEWMS